MSEYNVARREMACRASRRALEALDAGELVVAREAIGDLAWSVEVRWVDRARYEAAKRVLGVLRGRLREGGGGVEVL